jgi:hypothetical protein
MARPPRLFSQAPELREDAPFFRFLYIALCARGIMSDARVTLSEISPRRSSRPASSPHTIRKHFGISPAFAIRSICPIASNAATKSLRSARVRAEIAADPIATVRAWKR